jgi:hypothetical protein
MSTITQKRKIFDYSHSVKSATVLGVCSIILFGVVDIFRQTLANAYSLLSLILQRDIEHPIVKFKLSID